MNMLLRKVEAWQNQSIYNMCAITTIVKKINVKLFNIIYTITQLYTPELWVLDNL